MKECSKGTARCPVLRVQTQALPARDVLPFCWFICLVTDGVGSVRGWEAQATRWLEKVESLGGEGKKSIDNLLYSSWAFGLVSLCEMSVSLEHVVRPSETSLEGFW